MNWLEMVVVRLNMLETLPSRLRRVLSGKAVIPLKWCGTGCARRLSRVGGNRPSPSSNRVVAFINRRFDNLSVFSVGIRRTRVCFSALARLGDRLKFFIVYGLLSVGIAFHPS